MGRQRVYTGTCFKCQPLVHLNKVEFPKLILEYLRIAYSAAVSSYLPLIIVVFFLILSLFLPNKMIKNNELEVMKKILDHMTTEVDRAEIACMTAANEVHHLHSSIICNEETETEIAIMSIVYTDSFDSQNRFAGVDTIM